MLPYHIKKLTCIMFFFLGGIVFCEAKNTALAQQGARPIIQQAGLNTPSQQHLLSGQQVDSIEQRRQQKAIDLYQNVSDNIEQAQEVFIKNVAGKIDSLGNYSTQAQKDFMTFLQVQYQSFSGTINAVESSAKGDYFAFLEQNNLLPADAAKLDKQEREFLDGVHSLVQNALRSLHALMLDITSDVEKKQAILAINEAFAASDREAQAAYQQQLTDNEKSLNRSWWDELKMLGKELLGHFKTEFKKELGNQVQKVIAAQLGKVIQGAGTVVEGLGHKAADLYKTITPELQKQIDTLSKSLQMEKFSDFVAQADPAKRVIEYAIRITDPVLPPTDTIRVATTTALIDQEKTFVKNRTQKVEKILQQTFGISEPLRMSFCCSGGGVRAMIGTLGIFIGAARAKILQASMYMTGLSGSTWVIAPWAAAYWNGRVSRDYLTSLQQIRTNWTRTLNNPDMIKTPALFILPALTGIIASEFSHQVAVRIGYGDMLSAVDPYGAMVGNIVLDLMHEERLNVTWSSLAQAAQLGDLPLPLCSAAFDAGLAQPKKSGEHTAYEWFETGPFQAGSTQLGYIPVQHLGSSFNNGILDVSDHQLRPEYPLSFFEGVYGSAFGISLNDAIDKGLPAAKVKVGGIEVSLPIDQWIRNVVDEDFGEQARKNRSNVIHARFANFSQGVPTSVLSHQAEIGLFDGGVYFNFPLPLLTDRPERAAQAVDIVFIYDSNPGDVNSCHDLVDYYQRKGIAVPNMAKLSKAELVSKVMTVFNDPRVQTGPDTYNSKMPTIIYFPTRTVMPVPVGATTNMITFDNSKMPYITPNFKYTPEEMGNLVDAMDYAFTSQLAEIKEVMRLVAKGRHVFTQLQAELNKTAQNAKQPKASAVVAA